MVRIASGIVVLLLTALFSHPLDDGFYDRGVQALVEPERTEVRYELIVSPGTIRSDLQAAGVEVPAASLGELYRLYARHLLPEVVTGLTLTVDGRRLPLEPVSADVVFAHHPRVELRYEAPCAFTDAPVRVSLDDVNFAGKPGFQRIALKGRRGIEVVESTAAVDLVRVPKRDVQTLGPEEIRDTRRVLAVLRTVTAESFEPPLDGEDANTETTSRGLRESQPVPTTENPRLPASSQTGEIDTAEQTEADSREVTAEDVSAAEDNVRAGTNRRLSKFETFAGGAAIVAVLAVIQSVRSRRRRSLSDAGSRRSPASDRTPTVGPGTSAR